MITARDLVIFAVAVNAGWISRRAFHSMRGRIWQRLQDRHERHCRPLNDQWRRRIVRHPKTGRVGVCIGVCIQESGWRDLLFPRWAAKIAFSAELVRLMESRPESLSELLTTGMRVSMMAAGGGICELPLKEIAIAPASDATEFAKRKEEA